MRGTRATAWSTLVSAWAELCLPPPSTATSVPTTLRLLCFLTSSSSSATHKSPALSIGLRPALSSALCRCSSLRLAPVHARDYARARSRSRSRSHPVTVDSDSDFPTTSTSTLTSTLTSTSTSKPPTRQPETFLAADPQSCLRVSRVCSSGALARPRVSHLCFPLAHGPPPTTDSFARHTADITRPVTQHHAHTSAGPPPRL